jgi:hypothetical protein
VTATACPCSSSRPSARMLLACPAVSPTASQPASCMLSRRCT